MFDQFYVCPRALTRHYSAPLLEERRDFLADLAKRGLSRQRCRSIAQALLLIMNDLRLAHRSGETITTDEIKQTIDHKFRYQVAIRWLRFLGRLKEQPSTDSPFAEKINTFTQYMKHEQGLAPETIRFRCWLLPRLLNRLKVENGSLREVTPGHIDDALRGMLDEGKYARMTVRDWAGSLRVFFRYAESQGWCRKGLTDSIQGPRIYSQASLPLGPSWDEVRQLFVMTEGDRPCDIRARAILMLLAIYGLRNKEVTRLRLDDFDWEHELLTVSGAKTQRVRTWPLNRSVGDAVLRYLKEVRPKAPHREMFLTLYTPFRPLKGTWPIVAWRMRSISPSLTHHGSHALRHACATRLLDRGLTLKEIGDHLGHLDPDTTRIYAKVDIARLREVADFDMGGLL